MLGPLFLDDLDAQIDKAASRKALQKVLDRIAGIRVFDPACGSGNFLVVAYRELRAREMAVLEKLAELDGGQSGAMFSNVRLDHFYGIEITDFAAETAKLALFIAEYQANDRFKDVFGHAAPALPLRDGGNIVCDNALRLDWEAVCPPPGEGEEVFIAGNPPFLGYSNQSKEQKDEIRFVYDGRVKDETKLDYVLCWFLKASDYIRTHGAKSALVATNSVCQGRSVGAFWPVALGEDLEIFFAHQPFQWRNNASANAAVVCVVVGIQRATRDAKVLFDGDLRKPVTNINPYLLDGPNIVIHGTKRSLFGLPEMLIGNTPRDGGNLVLSNDEADRLREVEPAAETFLRPFVGSQELIQGKRRWCLIIDETTKSEAELSPKLAEKIEGVREFRLASAKAATRRLADVPFRFEYIYGGEWKHAILVPSVSSERRPYLPVDRVGADVIASNLNFALYDAPEWCLALIASRLHLVWIGTVCGKLKSDFRYSNTLGWNTFPVPRFTEYQLATLGASAREILRTRYMHHPKTIAQLYDPDKMPDDLRAVHKANDDLLEEMYIGRPFRNDTERLERLFKLYAARIEKLKQEDAA